MSSVSSDASSPSSPEAAARLNARRLVPACKRCHSLKVRCIPVEAGVHFGLCVRCQKKGSACEYELTTTKKRRNTKALTTVRKLRIKTQEVEELRRKVQDQERQIRALQGYQNSTGEQEQALSNKERLMKYGCEIDNLKTALSTGDDHIKTEFIRVSETRTALSEQYLEYRQQNIVDQGILSLDQCQRLINVFATEILPQYPFVELPSDLSAQAFMQRDYLLFLVVIYIGLSADEQSIEVPVETHLHLEGLITRSLGVEVLSVGTKNVALLRCLVVFCIWYPSPELFHQRRYHLFTLLCASLASDLGLTGRPYWFYNSDEGTFQRTGENQQSLEMKSLVLVIYIAMGSISLFLRRRVLFQWTEYMGQCCVSLEESLHKGHQVVALYARVSHVLEKIYVNVHATSEPLTVLELASANNRMLIGEYQNQLNGIKQRVCASVEDNNCHFHSLMAYLYSAQAYLYEPGIQALIRSKGQFTQDQGDTVYNTLSQLCESCILTVDHFLELVDKDITANPLFHTSRIIYTLGMLLKVRHLSLTIVEIPRWGLFTQRAVDLTMQFCQRLDSTIAKYPRNHFLKKVKIVMGLFTQTCLNQWYASYRDLSNTIATTELGFRDPRAAELASLENKAASQELNYPFHQISESGKGSQTQQTPLPSMEAIDDLEQHLRALNEELWTDLFFSEHPV